MEGGLLDVWRFKSEWGLKSTSCKLRSRRIREAAAERRPIDPSLPPDHPLEPGLGAVRTRSGTSPADRIAASEAALGPAKPAVVPDAGGKANFIAAARRAAQAAGNDAAAREKRSSNPIESISRSANP